MRLIHAPLSTACLEQTDAVVLLQLDRLRLAKRRWRGTADDGMEFGFDLELPFRDGTLFYRDGGAVYRIQQMPEPVIEIACPADPLGAARVGWLLGNLHFPLELQGGRLRVADDPAVRQMAGREGLEHFFCDAVFQPVAGGHTHGF